MWLVSLALATSLGLGLLGTADPSPTVRGCDDPAAGFLGGYAWIGGGCSNPAAPAEPGDEKSPEEIAALWDAYIASLAQSCRDAAPGPLAAARCDVIVVDRRGTPPIAGTDPITISDLARFTPLVGELMVEPDGWGVVGTPTNFYATAETHTMDGELFDAPIEVRWTPSAYRFDYGDGTVEETQASGSAWSGPAESWTETTTSHTYADREDVTASVTVIFTAEVDTGAGWFAVPGSLPVDAPSVSVKLFDVDTVLTNGDCMANPSAAGCG